jgi:hypothetical protein
MVLASHVIQVTNFLLVLVSFPNKSSLFKANLEADQLQLQDVLNKRTESALDALTDTTYQLVLVSLSAIYATPGLLMVLVLHAILVTNFLLAPVSSPNKSSLFKLNLAVDQPQ